MDWLCKETRRQENTLAQINYIACTKYFNDVNEWEHPSYNVQQQVKTKQKYITQNVFQNHVIPL